MKKKQAQPPPTKNLQRLREAAAGCTACHLYKRGTQTVFGEGPKHAALMVVGEQPGDKEDLAGHPFVGPAGALLDHICDELKIPRGEVYVTNAVKHFKWERQGKTRLHKKPNATEIHACHPWLESEVSAVQPKVILCLGATAAAAVAGRAVPVTASRGKILGDSPLGVPAMVSWHPSAILRSPTAEGREQKRNELKEDLRKAWKRARKS